LVPHGGATLFFPPEYATLYRIIGLPALTVEPFATYPLPVPPFFTDISYGPYAIGAMNDNPVPDGCEQIRVNNGGGADTAAEVIWRLGFAGISS